jgi:signal transduction histidine kinase
VLVHASRIRTARRRAFFPSEIVPENEAVGCIEVYRVPVRLRRRIPPYVSDTALALLLAGPTVGGLIAEEGDAPDAWIAGTLAGIATLPIAVRRYFPLPVLAITLAAMVALNLAGFDTFTPGLAVALYTVAARCERRTAVKAGAVTLAAVTPAILYSAGLNAESIVPDLVLLAAAWVLGDNLRTRRAYLRELEEKAERLERERDEDERRAAAAEQARIARELHDVIAHNVSVMVVQAAAGGEVFETNPARARQALASIEATGREALAEIRRLLGVVRAQEDGSASLAPQPGLDRLETLVEQVRAAGLAVELDVEGVQADLPAGVDLSAYRVVQEALTNTLKHAFAQRAWVIVRYDPRELVVEVNDDGAGPPRDGAQDGHGLIGMQERVGLFGGDLQAGARPDGGFRVSARFPLSEGEA